MRCFAEEVKCVSLSFDSSEVHYTAVKKCLDKQCAPSEVARVVKGKKEMGETGEGGGGAKQGRDLVVYNCDTVFTQYFDLKTLLDTFLKYTLFKLRLELNGLTQSRIYLSFNDGYMLTRNGSDKLLGL